MAEKSILTTVNLKPSRRPSPRRDAAIDRMRPLTFSSAPSRDIDVEHVHVYPEDGAVVISLVTNAGTATFSMPTRLAREVAEGLGWLARQRCLEKVTR
jgi:hypothetical protein